MFMATSLYKIAAKYLLAIIALYVSKDNVLLPEGSENLWI